MRDFIKEKKGTIGLILVVLSFFFVAIFLFTKAGRTPDRIINVWETKPETLVSRDTYKEFKDATNVYKLNNQEDPATRNMRAFMEKEKKTNKDKDKKDTTEDHGCNIANVLPFDAATLRQLNLKKLYTSVKDGPEREALMRAIQDLEKPLTQTQLQALSEYFKESKSTIEKTEKDDIRKIIREITDGNGIRVKHKRLKQQATSWVYSILYSVFDQKTANSIISLKNNYLPDNMRESADNLWDQILSFNVIGIIGKLMTMQSVLFMLVGFLIEAYQFIKKPGKYWDDWSFLPSKSEKEKFFTSFGEETTKGSKLYTALWLATSHIEGITQLLNEQNQIAFGAIITFVGCFALLGLCTRSIVFPSLIGLVGYAGWLVFTTITHMTAVSKGSVNAAPLESFLNPKVYSGWSTLAYYYTKYIQRFTQFAFFTVLVQLVQAAIQLFYAFMAAHHSAIFFNRLNRIHIKMKKLNDSYKDKAHGKAPYFQDIADFMQKKTPAYGLVSRGPIRTYVGEFFTGLRYMIFGGDYTGLDKVVKDQTYKKALASYLVLYNMTNQLDSDTRYSLLQEESPDDAKRSNPCMHIQGLRPFVTDTKEDKASLSHDVNIGHKSRAYILVGDDDSVMKDYLACIAENVIYTQNMGVIRGENKHYVACDKLFYADGYQDSREVHTARLEKIMRYAKQHSNEKILVLISNIAGKISGPEHAAFVHTYAAELKKLSNVTFVFSTCNVQDMYEVIDSEKVPFTLMTPLLKDKKPTGTITIGRSKGHVQNIEMLPKVAKKFRNLLKKNPNYKAHLQDHVSKDYSSSILFLIIMIFMVLGLMLFRKRAK